MNICGKCIYFRRVKTIYSNNGKVEDYFGFCNKDNRENDELISSQEPSCNYFFEVKEILEIDI